MQDLYQRWWSWLCLRLNDTDIPPEWRKVYSDGHGRLFATDGFSIHMLEIPGLPKGIVSFGGGQNGSNHFAVTDAHVPTIPTPSGEVQFQVTLDVNLLRQALEVHGKDGLVQITAYGGDNAAIEITGPGACAYLMPLHVPEPYYMVWQPAQNADNDKSLES